MWLYTKNANVSTAEVQAPRHEEHREERREERREREEPWKDAIKVFAMEERERYHEKNNVEELIDKQGWWEVE